MNFIADISTWVLTAYEKPFKDWGWDHGNDPVSVPEVNAVAAVAAIAAVAVVAGVVRERFKR